MTWTEEHHCGSAVAGSFEQQSTCSLWQWSVFSQPYYQEIVITSLQEHCKVITKTIMLSHYVSCNIFLLCSPPTHLKKQMQYHSYKQSLWYSACVPFTTQSEGLWYATHWDEFVCSPPKNPNNMQPSVDDVVWRSNADWLKSCLEQERDTSFATKGNRCEKIINDQNSSVRRTVLRQTVLIVSSKSFFTTHI